MVITVTVPDEFAAEAEARGLTPERYVEELLAGQHSSDVPEKTTEQRMADLEKLLDEVASISHKIPRLPDVAFTRASFYQDRD